jgi:hypothetical protein
MKVNRNINDTPIIRNGTEFLMCEQNLKIWISFLCFSLNRQSIVLLSVQNNVSSNWD